MASRLPADFDTHAGYLLHAIDVHRRQALVVEFTADDIRRASFLDDRALRPGMGGWRVGLEELRERLNGASPRPPGWLFHMGHVGSTAVSRALDVASGVLGLREPLPLLALAHEQTHPDFAAWLQVALAALGRCPPDRSRVVVKPTSVVTALAARLLMDPHARGVLLWSRLDTWLASHLRDPALVRAVLATASARGVETPQPEAPASALALLWVHEQLRWQTLSRDPELAGRTLALEFRPHAPEVVPLARRAGLHLGVTLDDHFETRVMSTGLDGRDAKRPEVPFDAGAHRRAVEAAWDRHAADIASAVAAAEARLAPVDPHGVLRERLRTPR